MIKSLHLKNWQCHVDKLIAFDRITVLTGDNDAGKSSVLRALLFVTLNVWDGKANDHVSWGADFSELTLKVDKHTIIRRKGPNLNEYQIDQDKPLVAFGAGVPEPVAAILKMDLDNFQQQHDLPYWILLAGGQAAKALNRIIDLDPIDNALANAAKEVREARTRVKVTRERHQQALKTKRELAWVKEAERIYSEAFEIEEAWANLEYEIRKDREKQERQTELLAREKELEQLINLGRDCMFMTDQMGLKMAEIKKLAHLVNLNVSISEKTKELETKQALLTKWSKGKCPLCEK